MNRVSHIVEKYNQLSRDNLIPILQEIQEVYGYLPEPAIVELSSLMKISKSKIYGVATFYNQFKFSPKGKFHISICRGTACHVKGSQEILMALEQELTITSGETTKDGLFSLEVVACIGACGLAPVISVNGEFHANLKKSDIKEIIQSYKSNNKDILQPI